MRLLLRLPTGLPPVATSRNKLLLTGEGRSGKTSLRQALKGAPFDPLQASTRGVSAEDLQVIREDLIGWREVVHRTPEEVRAIAYLVGMVLRNKADLSELSGLGLSESALDKLRRHHSVAAPRPHSANPSKPASANSPDRAETTQELAPRDDSVGQGAADAAPLHSSDGGELSTQTAAVAISSPAPTEGNEEGLDALIAEFMKKDDVQQKLILSLWDFGGQRYRSPRRRVLSAYALT